MKKTIMLTCMSSILLSSCAGVGPLNITGYSADSNDKCGKYVADLKNAESLEARAAIEGGVIGAAAGAVIGGLLGDWDTKAILIGAVSGGALGAGANYWAAVNKANNNIAAAHTQMSIDMQKSNSNIDNAMASLMHLKKCRSDEAKTIKERHKENLLSQEQAKKQISDVQYKLKEEIEVARDLEKSFTKKQKIYKEALETSIKADPNEVVREKYTKVEDVTKQIEADLEQEKIEEAGITYYALRRVNVRDEANLGGKVVGRLKARQQITGEPDPTEFKDWTYITMRSGAEGYVASRFISESDETKKYQKIMTRSLRGSSASQSAKSYIETTYKKASFSRSVDAIERDANEISF